MDQALMGTKASGTSAAIADLAAEFGNRLVTSMAIRQQHGHTTTWVANEPPDAVVFPQSTQDVQQAVRICARYGVPLIPFGAGTSFEGHVNAPFGGISLDLKDMNRILEVHADDFDCVIEPGVTRKQLNEYLRDSGLFFPVDPGADASLGGMASTRASGTTAVRYGTMKDNVIALKVVMPNGELLNTARRARKSSAGYDLTRLSVGAEGTFGIITELTLKLNGIPEDVAAGVCRFPSIQACCSAAITAIQAGIPLARVEFLDEMMVRVVNANCIQTFRSNLCCSWNFTVLARASPINPNVSVRSPKNLVAAISNGQPNRKIAPNYGRRATTHSGHANLIALERASQSRMCACLFPVSRNAS